MSLIKFKNQEPSLFDRFFENDFFDWSSKNFSSTNTTLPAVNIKETEDAYGVEMSAPGLKKSDFKLELNNNVLTISSEKKSENEEKEGENFTRREFCYESFKRSFTLPDNIKDTDIDATYNNGILSVKIPKKEVSKATNPKVIDVK